MRDQRFVAEHRGGTLTKAQHRLLMAWSCKCVEHVLPLLGEPIDDRLKYALLIAKKWEKGEVKTGEAMKASVGAHATAREYSDKTKIAVARAIGHAVATAHMADHSLGGALYALKALKNAGGSVDDERKWQKRRIPVGLKELVLETLDIKWKLLLR